MPSVSHRKIAFITAGMAVIMFLLAFALVPFYGLICKSTGINTSIPSRELSQASTPTETGVDYSRTVLVELLTTNHLGLPWAFYPHQKMVMVHPGEQTKVLFYAGNLTDHKMTVQAIPSMTPVNAIVHFHKIQCFCFSQQTLAAGEHREMPLIFTVDKQLPRRVHVITLAYTLFDVVPDSKTRKTSND